MQERSHALPMVNKAALKRKIERLDAPADIKLLLDNLLDTTLVVGGKIVQIGSRILYFILDFAKSHPGIALGVIVALVLAFLINSIPVFGPALSPILTPLLLIVGIGMGALNDLSDSSMKLKLSGLVADLQSL